MKLYDPLVAGTRRHPDKTALICDEWRCSYAELNDVTDRLARNLLDAGMRPGDRVALLFQNRPEIVQSYYACFKAGLIAVPLNIRMKAPELAYVLNHSGARLLLGQTDLFREIEPVRPELPALESIYLTGNTSDASGYGPYEVLLRSPAGEINLPEFSPDAPAVILYTSGTTARPKGVVHSHRGLLEIVTACASVMSADTIAVTAAIPPLSHMGSLGGTLLSTIHAGGTLLLFPVFDPAALLHAIEANRVTFFWLLPIMYAALAAVPGACPANVASVRLCLTAGDAMPTPIRERVRATFGLDPVDICGMTEMIYSFNPPGPAARAGSIGPPLPGVQMRLITADGAEAACGETGEILASGVGMMLGYWQDPDATAAALQNGWLHTGDLARRDEDGYYWFVGRKKDVIIRGGSNIAPAEVEEVLLTHPAVAAAGVVGVPDPLWGEAVWAYVALKPNATADAPTLQAHLRDRIAAYKIPETIRILPSLPMGLTGKIHRQTLRELAATDAAREA